MDIIPCVYYTLHSAIQKPPSSAFVVPQTGGRLDTGGQREGRERGVPGRRGWAGRRPRASQEKEALAFLMQQVLYQANLSIFQMVK